MRKMPHFEPDADDAYPAVRRCAIEMLREFGLTPNQLTLILGVETYRHLIGQIMETYGRHGMPPRPVTFDEVTFDELEGMHVVVDPTRQRFVCAVPPPKDCFLYFTDGTVAIPSAI